MTFLILMLIKALATFASTALVPFISTWFLWLRLVQERDDCDRNEAISRFATDKSTFGFPTFVNTILSVVVGLAIAGVSGLSPWIGCPLAFLGAGFGNTVALATVRVSHKNKGGR